MACPVLDYIVLHMIIGLVCALLVNFKPIHSKVNVVDISCPSCEVERHHLEELIAVHHILYFLPVFHRQMMKNRHTLLDIIQDKCPLQST